LYTANGNIVVAKLLNKI